MNLLTALLAAIPAIEKLLSFIVAAIVEAEKKKQKDSFKKSIESAILKGDQRAIEDSAGAPSGHQGVKVNKRSDEK